MRERLVLLLVVVELVGACQTASASGVSGCCRQRHCGFGCLRQDAHPACMEDLRLVEEAGVVLGLLEVEEEEDVRLVLVAEEEEKQGTAGAGAGLESTAAAVGAAPTVFSLVHPADWAV